MWYLSTSGHFFLIQTLQCAELCGKPCYVYICIYIYIGSGKKCMSTCVLCKHSNCSEGESLIIRTLMNNKHTVSKEPIAHIGLVVSQELCWSHTWRVPGASIPHAGWCSPNMIGDRCLWVWDAPKWGGSVLRHHHVALLVLEHVDGPVWPFPCIKSRIRST